MLVASPAAGVRTGLGGVLRPQFWRIAAGMSSMPIRAYRRARILPVLAAVVKRQAAHQRLAARSFKTRSTSANWSGVLTPIASMMSSVQLAMTFLPSALRMPGQSVR